MKKYLIYDDYNSCIPCDQKYIGAITQTCGQSALINGKKIIVMFDKQDKKYEKISDI